MHINIHTSNFMHFYFNRTERKNSSCRWDATLLQQTSLISFFLFEWLVMYSSLFIAILIMITIPAFLLERERKTDKKLEYFCYSLHHHILLHQNVKFILVSPFCPFCNWKKLPATNKKASIEHICVHILYQDTQHL